jgi:hypothetical protein
MVCDQVQMSFNAPTFHLQSLFMENRKIQQPNYH